MTYLQLAGTTALAALLSGNAALAAVTPEEVWQNWQDLGAVQGQTLTAATTSRNGDTLLIEGLTISVDQDDVQVTTLIDEVSFTDLGDGTVEIGMTDSYAIDITVPSSEGEAAEPTEVSLLVSHPDLSMIASGTAAEPAYSFDVPSLSIKLDEVQGVDAEKVDASADFTLTGLAGTYAFAPKGGSQALDSSFTATGMAMNVAMKDAEASSDVTLNAQIADLSGSTKGTFMDAAKMEDFAAALKAGFTTDVTFAYGKTLFDMVVTEPTGPTKIGATADSGAFNVAIDANRLAYGGGGKGVAMKISGPEIPFPELLVSYAEATGNFVMPVAKSDTPQEFSILTRLVGLVVSEEIWAMVDPMAQLPRDPATLIVDAKGTARLTVDLMDEAAMMALGDAPPGEVNSLDLTTLQLTVAGAELTGDGAMTFDNTDMTTFPGFPAPTGTVDLKVTGFNTLLDKLIAMGLVPEDQAMGARMMMSMFANAAPGEDTLTSAVEFKDKGLFVNGQRIQ